MANDSAISAAAPDRRQYEVYRDGLLHGRCWLTHPEVSRYLIRLRLIAMDCEWDLVPSTARTFATPTRPQLALVRNVS